ncbi:hypothetical protein CERSUDRAFT_80426 [Gelatoporia subvermispora B]|uniref:DUF7704 domain-containing protein n=1 Tax=Ceriporiopsis subvermispora (strain B) TaxID=914234 RepID=M2RPG1_CERS8|nr:hypothetical protein CERSUDRAFT_80426 [Gelatoporia subvermispora B]
MKSAQAQATPPPPSSALPTFYWLVFGVYEPLLTLCGFMGVLADPKQAFEQQAPWPSNTPPEKMSSAAYVCILQLANVGALCGLINLFVLQACRKHLFAQPALQETIVGALLSALLIGDIAHLTITLWALGESRWEVSKWGGLLWVTIVSGLSLMVPRIAWHLGIGRYVDRRDGQFVRRG